MSGPANEGSGNKKGSESRLSRGFSRNGHSPVRPPELMSEAEIPHEVAD